MDFGEVLSRAWNVVWKHKVLWIFGILVGCSQGVGGGSGNARVVFSGDSGSPEIERFLDQFSRLPDGQIALIVGAGILVILILIILAIFLGTIGRIGLIHGTLQAEQEVGQLRFGELFSGSLPFFWRIFGLNLIIGLAVFLLVLILIAPFIAFTALTMGIGALCIIPLICVAVPVGWFVGAIIEQANVAIVVDDLGILAGLKRGWDIVRNNLGPIIVMALILFLGVSLVGGLIIGLPLIIVFAPAVIGVITGSDEALGGGLLVSGICFLAYLPFLLVLSGILQAYLESAWTLTYLRLSRKAAPIEPSPVMA